LHDALYASRECSDTYEFGWSEVLERVSVQLWKDRSNSASTKKGREVAESKRAEAEARQQAAEGERHTAWAG